MTAAHKIRFFFNGFKINDGKLERARLSFHLADTRYPLGGTTRIAVDHADHCGHFSKEAGELFEIRNNTDTMTDYFERDRGTIPLGHPLFALAAVGVRANLEHDIKHYERMGLRHPQRRYHESTARAREQLAQLDAVLAADKATERKIDAGLAQLERALAPTPAPAPAQPVEQPVEQPAPAPKSALVARLEAHRAALVAQLVEVDGLIADATKIVTAPRLSLVPAGARRLN